MYNEHLVLTEAVKKMMSQGRSVRASADQDESYRFTEKFDNFNNELETFVMAELEDVKKEFRGQAKELKAEIDELFAMMPKGQSARAIPKSERAERGNQDYKDL